MTAIEEIESLLSIVFTKLEKLKEADIKRKPLKVDKAMMEAKMYIQKRKQNLK